MSAVQFVVHVPPLHEPGEHSLSGSVSVVMLRQRPFAWPVFALEHAWQAAPQALSQQNPSTQVLLEHWWLPVPSIGSAAQDAPCAPFGAQEPPTVLVQKKPAPHCASAVQVEEQVPEPVQLKDPPHWR